MSLKIQDFIKQYDNYPILFVGAGLSLRYLENSYSWDGLLARIAKEIYGNTEQYLNIKSNNYDKKEAKFNFYDIATKIEKDFQSLMSPSNKKNKLIQAKFKYIKDFNLKRVENGDSPISYLKLYIAELTKNLIYKEEMQDEIELLRVIKSKFSSIITTNYDSFIEHLLGFSPIIGNELICTNPYGSVYKIHGCHTEPNSIVITSEDAKRFDDKFLLIKAQLLSLFLHNPIIFIGYRIDDKNIRDILKTIFSYVEPNSEQGKKIESNFLFIERQKDSQNIDVTDYEIEVEDGVRIKIQKIATNDFSSIYLALADLKLECSIADIKKVEDVFHKIKIGGDIYVNILRDIADLVDNQKVLAIGHVYQEAVNVKRKKPKQVIKEVNNKTGLSLAVYDNTCLVHIFQIQGKKDINKITNTQYCLYDQTNNQYLYTDAWIDFIVTNVKNGKLAQVQWKDDHKKKITKDIDTFITEV
jgi:hypothetical protein